MHPVTNVDFGNETGKIEVKFHNGSSVVTGYIVKQLSATKFIVSADGITKFTCKLSVTGTPVAGEFTIEVFAFDGSAVSSTAEHAKRLTNTLVYTIEGHRYVWSVAAPTKLGYAQISSI